jgi:D-alanyl-D-alanine carboxypeptidase (penicillin-binding protein 5/6)
MRFTGSTASSLRALPLSILGFAAALLMVAAQLVHSPAPAHAVPQPAESTAPAYVSPEDLGDGAKPPKPTGTSWLVGDLDSGELHVAKNVEERHAPASTIKLLTALALVDEFDDKKKKVTAEFEDMEIDGTKVGLMQTNKYSIDLLFHAMLMSSANDAANALGRAAGGQDKAVKLMNEKAAELGMSNTQAKNTSGLDAKGQYTTAEDLMKLAWAVCEDDYLMKVIGTETFKFPGGKNPQTKEKFKGYEIQNHTKIVGRVDGGLGLKNGFTRAAKGSYVAVAERDGHRVVTTMLGIDNNSRQVAVDLLEWDFARSPRNRCRPFLSVFRPPPRRTPPPRAARVMPVAQNRIRAARSNLRSQMSQSRRWLLKPSVRHWTTPSRSASWPAGSSSSSSPSCCGCDCGHGCRAGDKNIQGRLGEVFTSLSRGF